ncbi:MAG: hypothetical protein KDA80_15260 [Planctomycetaceae bacterium]|nr:hypothetical protein [Planctomycetaceae bacterium]
MSVRPPGREIAGGTRSSSGGQPGLRRYHGSGNDIYFQGFPPMRDRVVSLCLLMTTLVCHGVMESRYCQAAVPTLGFHVQFTEQVRSEPYSGRVYLFFSANRQTEPRNGPNWMKPEPFVSLDVTHWKPGEQLTISLDNPGVLTFPRDLMARQLLGMSVQAVARFNPWEREVGTGPGNGYSRLVSASKPGTYSLTIDRLVQETPFPASPSTKEFRVSSNLLSEFFGHDVEIQAAVTVPESYGRDPDRRYPVIFEIPGFGGTHRLGVRMHQPRAKNTLGVEFIRVMLDPSCPLGHHVFADSANNGPWGTALVEEFLPAFEAAYRTIAEPRGRFLTGHSSGGWSSLWIQITHPDTFGGVWSTAPDPVDFRDFQRIDLYQSPQNMYVHGDQRRPLARMNGRTALWYDDFTHMETVLGYGGQLHSFEAVFSKRNADGTPALLYDRETGAVDTSVAESWKKYDIRLLLEENWKTFGPKLAGKLHVFMGTEDTFLLEGATQLLKESLERLGSDAQVEMIPGRTHFDLFADGLDRRIEQQMARKFRESTNANLQNSPEINTLNQR